MSVFNVPGVGPITSTARTKDQMNVLWQDLVLQMLGITPAGPDDSAAYSQVRLTWPTDGQPDWPLNFDVCFVETVTEADSYDQIMEHNIVPNDDTTYTLAIVYTRVWRVRLVAYGPNSGDRLRQTKTCMTLDFVHDTLAESNIYLIFELGTPRRNPELFTNDWWERWDFSVRMNEQVTDTLVLPTMASVEVVLRDAVGIRSDQTITF